MIHNLLSKYLNAFLIPVGLDEKECLCGLSPKLARRAMGFIHVICRNVQNDNSKFGYVSLPASYLLKAVFGNDSTQKKVIKHLADKGVIEVNHSYSNAAGRAFCKSYRISKPYAIKDGFRVNHVESSPSRYKSRKHGGEAPRASGGASIETVNEGGCSVFNKSELGEYFIENVGKLTLNEAKVEKLLGDSEIAETRKVRIAEVFARFQRGGYSFRRGKTQSRVYSVVTQMPRELRGCLELDGKPLVEADVKACQPTLLLTLCTCGEEKAKLTKLLEGDFYTGLFGEGISRERIKYLFALYLAQNGQNKFENPVADTMRLALPRLHEAIVNFDGSVAAHLQDLEANLVVDSACGELRKKRAFCLTIHDAIISRQEDVDLACEELRRAFQSRQLPVHIKIKACKCL